MKCRTRQRSYPNQPAHGRLSARHVWLYPSSISARACPSTFLLASSLARTRLDTRASLFMQVRWGIILVLVFLSAAMAALPLLTFWKRPLLLLSVFFFVFFFSSSLTPHVFIRHYTYRTHSRRCPRWPALMYNLHPITMLPVSFHPAAGPSLPAFSSFLLSSGFPLKVFFLWFHWRRCFNLVECDLGTTVQCESNPQLSLWPFKKKEKKPQQQQRHKQTLTIHLNVACQIILTVIIWPESIIS